MRLSVAHELGCDIDGAWWPRTKRIHYELPQLVAVLKPTLGEISSVHVSWPPLQRPPDLNWPGWEHKRQHVITIKGADAHANLLVIPYATNSALAWMMLRHAANLPIDSAAHDEPTFTTADSILRSAQQQSDSRCT